MSKRGVSSTEQIHQGKEVKSMKYEKPEVQAVGPAVSIVERMGKGTSNIQDSQTTWESASAYEADE
jgi:hypothetical protein